MSYTLLWTNTESALGDPMRNYASRRGANCPTGRLSAEKVTGNKKDETVVAKVVLKMHQTIDGFVCTAAGDDGWIYVDSDASVLHWESEQLGEAERLIMGRKLYEGMAAFWPTADEPLARPFNEMPKVVFSQTLKLAAWGPVRIATGDLAQEIAQMKQQAQKNILALGGASFAQSLARLNLVDEYRLLIHPVALGSGKPCIRSPLDLWLTACHEFPSGVVALIYSRA